MIDPNQPDFNNSPIESTWADKFKPVDLTLDPVISIITPFYNTGEIFYETAKSVLNQSLQQFEWIIVDDGSTSDISRAILNHYANLDPRVRVVRHSENKGLSAARNTGIKASSTDYLLMIDSDDLIEPTAAEIWFWHLKTHQEIYFVDSYHVAFGGKNYLWTGGIHDGAMILEKNRISMICMVRKSAFELCGGFDESLWEGLEDWDFWLNCASKGIWGDTIPEFLGWYRVRKDHSDRWKNLTEEGLSIYQANIRNKYPDLNEKTFPKVIKVVDLDLTKIQPEESHFNKLKGVSENILIIIPWMVMGGAERFVLNLVQQLNSRGWHVSIVTTSPSENKWRHEFEQLTEDIFVLPDFLKIADFGKFINYLIESRGVNILFTQGSIEGYRLLPYISRNNPDLSIVDYLHFVTEDWMDGGFPELSAIYESYIDRTIVSSEQLKRWLITRQINPDKISVCYIGVDADFWTKDIDKRSAFRKNYNLNDDDFVILFAGRLEEQKSPLFLLDILKEPGLKGLKIKTLVAGEGSLKPAMLKKIKELGLENSVALIGEVSTADMPGFLNAGDVFFLPSKNEGISSAVYEAMSVGLPVIASNVGGQDELVDEGSGYLVDADANDAALVFARHILDLYSDKEKRIGIGQHARKRIEANFTLDKMGTRIDSILKAQLFMEKSSKARFPERQVAELQDQLTIEYLQARNEWNKLNILHTQLYRQFEKLNEPKPTSHWFYLWVRQLFLPIYRKLNTGKKQKGIQRIKEFVLKFLKPSTGSD